MEGKNADCIIIDELHEYKHNQLVFAVFKYTDEQKALYKKMFDEQYNTPGGRKILQKHRS